MSKLAQRPPVSVSIVAFDGCMTAAVAGVLDALVIANGWARQGKPQTPDAVQARVVSVRGGYVMGSNGFTIATEALSPEPSGVVIVPPAIGSLSATLAANEALIAWLRRPHSAVVASVCSGAFFLAEAGLLDGCRATTSPPYEAAFRKRYKAVELMPEARVIDEGNVLCAGSTTAFLDLAIHLLERFVNHEVALLTAKSMCMDLSQRSQLPYFSYVAPKDHGDDAVLALQSWMEQNLKAQLSARALARRAALSERSMNRRFRSATGLPPLKYMHRLRVELAKRLLETSSMSVEEITSRVGYEDARSFSRLFRTVAGVSPRAYRARFGRWREPDAGAEQPRSAEQKASLPVRAARSARAQRAR